MNDLDLLDKNDVLVREHGEQREQANEYKGFDRSHKAVPGGNNENSLVTIMNPLDIPPPIFSTPEIDRPCYMSHSDYFMINGIKMKPGLYLHSFTKSEVPVPTDDRISAPLTVEATTSSADGEDFGRLLKFIDSHDQWHEWAMPMHMLKGSGEELRGELLNQGFTFNTKKRNDFVNYIMDSSPNRRITAATRIGWHGDKTFVLPNQVIGGSDVVFQSEVPRENEFKVKGTLEGWQQGIGTLSRYNITLMVSICVALAGPLLKKVNRQGGGIHWFGDSSSGKSTSLEIAASVWGSPDIVQSWNATANGLEGVLTMRNDTCLFLDEIDEASPQEISKISYMITNGQGKRRAGRLGNAREIQRWRTMTISTGERTLSSIMGDIGKQANSGQLVRLLNIPAGFEYGIFRDLHGFADGRGLADHLKSLCSQDYGHLGPAFIRCLMEKGNLPGILSGLIEAFPKNAISSRLESRAIGMLLVAAMAGELAIECGLLPWGKEEAFFAITVAYERWRKSQSSGQSEHTRILENISSFTVKNDIRFSSYQGEKDIQPVINRAGWHKGTDGERTYMFLPEALVEAAGKFDKARIVKALQEAGWIVDYDEGRCTKKTRTPMGQKNLYYIRVPDQE